MDEKLLAEMFSIRLSKLRINKNVSARDMSLSLGLNAGYINNIESGKALPSMGTFFLICNYLNIEPKDFFDYDSSQPEEPQALLHNLKKLNPRQLSNIASLVEDLTK